MQRNKKILFLLPAFMLGVTSMGRTQSGNNSSPLDKPTAGKPSLAKPPIDKPTLEFDVDVRSNLTSAGTTRTALYSSTVRFDSGLAPGLGLHLFGARKYGDFLMQEATIVQERGSNRVGLGMIRIPFGIYNYQETYASGLINYPLARVDYAYNSVDWGVPGVQWTGGNSRMQIEAAAFSGRASGVWGNTNTVGGGAARVQTFAKNLILGASYWDGYYDTEFRSIDERPVRLAGLDVRYTIPHLILRGEYLAGLFGGEQAHGWYLDTYYHLPKYEKWTLTARLEQYRPGGDDPVGEQITLGVRYAATKRLTLVVNWALNNGSQFYDHTWTPFTGKAGELIFQVYHKIKF